MSQSIHPYPSVGSLVKKVLEINPDLGVREISSLIRQSILKPAQESVDFASGEIVDEKRVMELAKATLIRKNQ